VDLVYTRVDEVSSQNRLIITQNERSRNVQDGMNATLALLMDKHDETKRELHLLRSQTREQQSKTPLSIPYPSLSRSLISTF
jgi:hypothetical protein